MDLKQHVVSVARDFDFGNSRAFKDVSITYTDQDISVCVNCYGNKETSLQKIYDFGEAAFNDLPDFVVNDLRILPDYNQDVGGRTGSRFWFNLRKLKNAI